MSLAAALATSLLPGPAYAQAKKQQGTTDKGGNALGRLVMLHDLEASRQTDLGRAKMKAGDCKAALDAFDAAMKGSNDPTVRRDRGLCHENLGHPYPAMDDYRAYLTALPDAPDAANIRERLDRLQGDALTPDETKDEQERRAADASAKATMSISVGNGGASASGGASTSTASSGVDDSASRELTGRDAAVALERKEAVEAENLSSNSSALRRGKGPVIGVTAGPRWYSHDSSTRGGYMVAGSLRYSASPVISALVDLGYAGISNDQGSNSSQGGIALLAGIEARLRLDQHVSNAILLGGGLGYERLKQGSSGLVTSMFVPRVRAGYRHVFGPSFGLEVTLDAGYAFASVVNANASYNALIIGPNVGLVTAF